MTAVLLDVNVLLAILDPKNLHHEAAQTWFGAQRNGNWATCPLVQNGYVRIASQPSYGNPVSTSAAIDLLRDFTAHADHEFWSDSISILDPALCRSEAVRSSRRVTDIYLVALASANGGRLATFDSRFSAEAVVNAGEAILLLG